MLAGEFYQSSNFGITLFPRKYLLVDKTVEVKLGESQLWIA
jgi:hypothetical protein